MRSIVISNNSKNIAAACTAYTFTLKTNNFIKIWDINTGYFKTLDSKDYIETISFNSDDTKILALSNYFLYHYDIKNNTYTNINFPNSLAKIELFSDSKYLLPKSSNNFQFDSYSDFLNIETLDKTQLPSERGLTITSVKHFKKDIFLILVKPVLGLPNSLIKKYDLETKKYEEFFDCKNIRYENDDSPEFLKGCSEFTKIAISPDKKYFALKHKFYKAILIFDLNAKILIQSIYPDTGFVDFMEFSSDNKYLIMFDRNNSIIYVYRMLILPEFKFEQIDLLEQNALSNSMCNVQ